MLESIIKNYDELPLFLNAKNLSKVLGLSESSVYTLRFIHRFIIDVGFAENVYWQNLLILVKLS